MASVPDDAEVTTRLRRLLGEVEMDTTSARMLHKMLEEELGVDLTEKKTLIRDEIEKFLKELAPEQEEEDYEGGEEEPRASKVGKKRKKATSGSSVLSQELQDFLGVDWMARTEITKKLWEYIKKHELQDPDNKRNILVDDTLGKLFTSPLTMLTIPKQLSKHITPSSGQNKKVKKEEVDEEESEEENEDEEDEDQRPARPRRAKTSSSGKTEGKKRGGGGGGGFKKPIKVTSELAEFLGTDTISRPDLTKFMWNYFKTNGLQDPKDKRHILSDEKLKALLKVDRFQAFSFMKFLKHHVVS